MQRLDKIIASHVLALDSSDYDFKYTNQEFILSICSSLQLNSNQAQQYINAVQTKSGVAGIWGKAQQFLFFVEKDFAYVLNLEGNMVGKRSTSIPNAAALTVIENPSLIREMPESYFIAKS